jgi:hypothetical protein
MTPVGLPSPERYPHGARARYVSGKCRCALCRKANTAYENERAAARRRGEWNGLVDAAPVLEHLHALSRQGVGYKAVADACDVSRTTLQKVLNRTKRKLRKASVDRVLATDAGAVAGGARVPAAPLWRMVREIRAAGLTDLEIVERLGRRHQGLQFGRRLVLASSILEMKRLHAQVMRELEIEKAAATICAECGQSHDPEDRRKVVLRMLPCTGEDLREAHPCWWDGRDDSARERRLYRDLDAVGAVKVAGIWAVQAKGRAA